MTTTDYANSPGKYWLHRESKFVVGALETMHNSWGTYSNSPIKQAWIRNYLAYYSPVLEPGSYDTSLIFEGVQGELVRFFTPRARVLMRQLVSLITKQRLSFQATAKPNANSDIIKDIKLGNSVAEYLIDSQRLDVKDDELVEGALVCGNWFTKATWRTDLGEPYTAEDKRIIYKGGVEVSLHSVFDVFYNVLIPYWEMQPWVEVRTIKNRWDLIAQHPEFEDELMNVPSVARSQGSFGWFDTSVIDEDQIYVYEFFARPCPSLPNGRMVVYASPEAVFFDDDNPYRDIPVEPMAPERIMNTGAGYPMFTNIIAAQEMYDNSLSAIATNQAQFAVQNVAVPRGADIAVTEINGMRFMHYTPQAVEGGGLPKAVQLTASAPETFKFSELLGQTMQELSMLNGALVGKPPQGVTSGVAIATLSANAIEFINTIAKARTLCWEKTLDHAINAHVRFGKIETTMPVKGKNGKVSQSTFKGEELQSLSGMKMDLQNPLMQTVGGRLEVANQILQMPKEVWPEYVSILEGRPLSEITKGALSESDLIWSENDDLQAGRPVLAVMTDDHPDHIMKHKALLNSPDMRRDNPNVKLIVEHIQEHIRLEMSMDPTLKAILRTGKAPQMGPEGPGGGPMGGMGGGPQPPPGPIDMPGPEGKEGPPKSAIPLPQVGRVANPRNDLLGRQGAETSMSQIL